MLDLYSYFKSAPSFTIWYSHPGEKTRVLITAGVDGDEYVGIAAAKKLIKTYKGTIPIAIIPIVNIAGSNQRVSWNPLDNRFPKHIFPGSVFGSSSSRLMQKVNKLISKNMLWIDLHGGSTDEHLSPFIWAGRSGRNTVDSITTRLLSHLSGKIVYELNNSLPPTHALSKKEVSYILLEAGEKGKVDTKFVNIQLNWINTIFLNLNKPPIPNWIPTYNAVEYNKYSGQDIKAKNILWYSPTSYVSGKITTT